MKNDMHTLGPVYYAAIPVKAKIPAPIVAEIPKITSGLNDLLIPKIQEL